MTDDLKWSGLIDTFNVEDLGEFKVVKTAEGIAPWGSKIKAELHESEIGSSVLVSLPELGGRNLAILNGRTWEIWVTPRNEIHVVRPLSGIKYPPDEYLWLTGK